MLSNLLLASSLAIAILGLTPAHADEPAQPIACSAIPACAEQLKKAKQLTKEQRDDDALQAFWCSTRSFLTLGFASASVACCTGEVGTKRLRVSTSACWIREWSKIRRTWPR